MLTAKRYPRARFTRSLVSLCERLDERQQVEFDYISPRGSLVPVHGRLRATARVLWAFGSWAHGAAECGDLDLALTLRGEWVGGHGWLPDGSTARALPGFDPARKALLTAPSLVRILNSDLIFAHGRSGDFAVHPDSMKPIWIAPDLTDQEKEVFGLAEQSARHWGERIEAIKLDPNYKRVARLSDIFPFRIEQTAMDLQQVDLAVKAQAQGLISWEFLSHGECRGDEGELSRAERALLIDHDCSDLAQISRVLAATRDVRRRHRKIRFWYGKCGVWASMLDDRSTNCIVITPKWSAQGPNGSLVITRGPNYSTGAIKAFKASSE